MYFRGQRGISLLGAVIATGIGGVLTLALTKSMANNFDASSHLSFRVDRDAIKRSILYRSSCSMSLPCTPNTLVDVKDDRGETLISSSNVTRYGKFALRAKCNTRGDGFHVQYALLKQGKSLVASRRADFLKDKFTGKLQSWQGLFPGQTSDGLDFCSGTQTTTTNSFCGTGPQTIPLSNHGSSICTMSGMDDDAGNKFKIDPGAGNPFYNQISSSGEQVGCRLFGGQYICPNKGGPHRSMSCAVWFDNQDKKWKYSAPMSCTLVMCQYTCTDKRG